MKKNRFVIILVLIVLVFIAGCNKTAVNRDRNEEGAADGQYSSEESGASDFGLKISPNPRERTDEDIAKITTKLIDDPSIGSQDARVVMEACEDFQCPYCRKFVTETLPDIMGEYVESGKIRYVSKDFPLPGHDQADEAAVAANCAGQQGKYWEMHDILYEKQVKWSGQEDAMEIFRDYAAELNLDLIKFDGCANDPEVLEEIRKDYDECARSGIIGTPIFYINGQLHQGAMPFSYFKEVLNKEV